MKRFKYLFIDRDGTLIVEPEDKQVDSIEKLQFMPGVFTSLKKLIDNGFKLILISNQDGLGTDSLTEESFNLPQQLMLKIFKSQGIEFEDIRICPHFSDDGCDCRKPNLGLLVDYLREQTIDRDCSYVIGDRETDIKLGENMGLSSILIGSSKYETWDQIVSYILDKPRTARIERKTNETNIDLLINLDSSQKIKIDTGISFFDHMLEQFAKHSGISLKLNATGDTHIDDHHTVEDIAIVIGSGIRKALGDKIGIARYGFLLPMDESLTKIAIDLSGRPGCHFNADFKRAKIGDFSTELVAHFFSSFSDGLRATLHVDINGKNTHHMIESSFKCLGRIMRQAIRREGDELPSTKGLL